MSENQIISIQKPDVTETPESHSIKDTGNIHPSETISLPSKGWFYPPSNVLSSGNLELKIMTAKEEDILTSKNLYAKGLVLDKLLESLIIDKTVNTKEMLNCDRDAAFVAIRRLAYGDKYDAKIMCRECRAVNDISINLGELKNSEFDENQYPKGENEFIYEFPDRNKVTYKLLTKQDEDNISQELKNLEKVSKEVSHEVTTRLAHIITSVNGDKTPGAIRNFINNLRSRYSLDFRNHVYNSMPKFDMSFDFTCQNCASERKETVPLGTDFFWPDE